MTSQMDVARSCTSTIQIHLSLLMPNVPYSNWLRNPLHRKKTRLNITYSNLKMIKESNKTNPNPFDGLILEISNQIHITKLPSKRRKCIGSTNGRIPTFSYLGDANADTCISKTRPSNELRLILLDSLIIFKLEYVIFSGVFFLWRGFLSQFV